MDPNQIAKRLNQFRVEGQYQDQVRGLTGKKAANGQLILRDGSMTANQIYVRVDGLDANVIVARNLKVNNNIANVPVLMKPVQPGSREYKIVDADVVQTDASFGNGATVAGSPALSGEAIAAAGAITVTSPMIKPFKMVKGPSGGLNVQVYGGWHRKGLFVTSEIDLTSARPATAGKQAWVLVYVDPETNTLKTVTGDEYDQGSELHFSILADIAVPVGAMPVGGVVLTDTQTTIDSNADIQDRRDWLDYSDADAVHTTVSGEFAGLTEKVTPVSGDLLLIEDSADANSKKYIQIGNLPGVDFEGGVVINDAGGDFDFRVESDNETHAFFLDGTNSNIGLRTDSPIYTFTAQFASTSTSALDVPTIAAYNTSLATNSIAYVTARGDQVIGRLAADGLGTSAFILGSDAGVAIGSASDHIVAFITNNNERMRLDTSGNFGVGTPTPAGRVHVYDTANAGHYLIIDAQGTGTSQQATIELLTLGDGSKLTGDAATKGWHMTARGNAFSTAAQQNDLHLYFWDGSAYALALAVDSATRWLGINTNNPGAALDVAGNANIGDPTDATNLSINGAAANNRQLIYRTTGTNRWAVYANGTAESGSNAGSDFAIGRFSDAGSFLGNALVITRSNAKALLAGEVEIDGNLNHDGSNVGFYGTTPVAKPTVSGSRGGNAALASLLTALASQGLITNSTTA